MTENLIYQILLNEFGGNKDFPISDSALKRLSDEIEGKLIDILQTVKIIHEKTNDMKLKVRNFNSILKSMNIKPLLGYFSDGEYNMRTLKYDSGDGTEVLSYLEDKNIKINSEILNKIVFTEKKLPIEARWLVCAGEPIVMKKNVFKRNKNVTDMTGLTYGKDGYYPDYGNEPDNLTMDNVLSSELQEYYNMIVTTIFNDCDKNDIIDDLCGNSCGYDSLIPYLLQHFMYLIAKYLDNIDLMLALSKVLLNIVKMPYINIDFYTHTILRIASSLILKSLISDDFEKEALCREISANIFMILAERCSSSFPSIFDQLYYNNINILFLDECPLQIFYGALQIVYQLLLSNSELLMGNNILYHIHFIIDMVRIKAQKDIRFKRLFLRKIYLTLFEIAKLSRQSYKTPNKEIEEIFRSISEIIQFS